MSWLSPHLGRANRQLRRSPRIARGLDQTGATWWRLVDAFCATVDPVLARFFPDQRLVAVLDGDGTLALHRVGKGEAKPLGPLAALDASKKAELASARWSAVELRLPAAQVLQRRLSLPGASREFLAPILEHRLERLTPWRPDKVLYGYSVPEDGQKDGVLDISLLATTRDAVAPPLQQLAEAGLVPTAVGASVDPLASPLAINLISGATAAHADSRRWMSRAALITLGLLGAVFITSTIVAAQATRAADATTQKLAKARHLLRASATGEFGSREQAMLDAKQPDRTMVVLINKLAGAIPPDTFLKELTISPDKVRLAGLSSNAPALVGEVESVGLKNVRFTSSLTRERTGQDSFELSADRALPKADDAP